MRTSHPKQTKQIQFLNGNLYLRTPSNVADNTYEVVLLGTITTRKGGLTRKDKLRAVAANGDWIDI